MSVKTSPSAPAAPTSTGRSPAAGNPSQTDGLHVREFSARDLSARVNRSAEVVEALSRQYRILDTLREAANQLVVHRPLLPRFPHSIGSTTAALDARVEGATLAWLGGNGEGERCESG